MKNFLQKMSRRKIAHKSAWLMMVFFQLTAMLAMGQSRSISGRVTSKEDNSGIPGVSIQVKGTSMGTNTNAEGRFSLSVNANAVLQVSMIGYKKQEVAVGAQTELSIILVGDDKQLQEVVVTALGIKKEVRKIGVSIQSLDGAAVVKAREPNAINALVGKVAGLTVGAQPELLRKPTISLRGNSTVLYVVDGVPINSDTWNISPDDIETYSVLKGASASALYGFRGKNGAILITTKRGSKDKRGFSVEANSSTMMENGFYAIPEVQDEYGPGDHGRYAFGDGKGGGLNDGDYDGGWGPKFNGQLIPQYDSPVDPITGVRAGTPWINRGKDNLKRFLETGILSTNNVSVSATGDKYNLRFSTSHIYQKGIVPNTKMNITNFNIVADYKFSDKLKFESNLQYNRQYTPNIPDVNYGPNSIIYNIVYWAGADWNVDDMRNYWQKGKEGIQQIYAEYQRYNNPYFMSYEWLRGHYKNDVVGQAALRYQLADGLEVLGRTQVTTWDMVRTEKFPYSAGSYGRDERRGDYREDRRSLFENNTELLVSYDKDITSGLNTKITAGGSMRTFQYKSMYGTTDYLNVPGLYNFANSSNPVKLFNFGSEMRVLSAYYSADFSYKNFITVSTTGRLDKLSTLPAGNNAFFYPSVSAATVLSDYIKLPEVISFLKFRASYANVKDGLTASTIGTTPSIGGGNPIGYGEQYQSPYDGPAYTNSAAYSTFPLYNNQTAASYTNTLNNPNLNPSSTTQKEIGMDLRIVKNRLGLDVTYWNSLDGPSIFSLPISTTSGYSSALVNGIKTEKNGFDISLTGTPIKTESGFTWDVVANYGSYIETLKEIYPGVNSLNTFLKVGDRLDKMYGRAFVRTPEGKIINDASGRPIYNPVSQHLGNINSDFVYGINNKFTYKNVSLSFQFDGRVGGVISNYTQRQTYRGGRHIGTTTGIFAEARPQDFVGVKAFVGEGVQVSNGVAIAYDVDGKVTNYSALQYTPNTTKQFVQDYVSRYYNSDEGNLMSRTFSMLREVNLTFNLPSAWFGKFVHQANVSLVGRNLFYFAEKTDIDLNQYVFGGESGPQTPSVRRYGVNFNVTF
ncbi:SusC/RagA family TonB-linked outer membrane protein [Aquirufa ecclesiirivi]|uniref:SusC/RagA family TonB-linked outer membrane protein n=1 Tax=Aquirufa ecclesiirivi TaxID=2715124 RepID=UPI002E769839|nr:SusC/RagA family TonB-linked outer membrane protein [Aquirufa ecclesiirivi]